MSLTAAVLDLANHLTEVSDLGYNKITVDPPQDGFAVANMTNDGCSTSADTWRQ